MDRIIGDNIFRKYLGQSFDEILSECATYREDYTKVRAKKFNSMVDSDLNKKAIYDYYCTIDFLRDQVGVFGNTEEYYNQFTENIFNLDNLFYGNRKVNVLDYGCGNSRIGMKYLLKGNNVTFADIPHNFFKVLEEGITLKYDTATFCPIINDKIHTEQKYELILCNEVLEHCVEPMEVLEHLVELLIDGGVLHLSTFFNDCNGQDPSHLVRNTERYNHCQTWHKIVGDYGLEPVLYNEGGSLKVWKKPFSSTRNKNKHLDKYS